MTEIAVTAESEDTFRVEISERGSVSTHVVIAEPSVVERLGGGVTGEELVEASFRFLLDREPREAILSRFDLPVISRYFPDYESAIGDYLT